MSELARSIEETLARAEAEDPEALPYLLAYFHAQVGRLRDGPARAVCVEALERRPRPTDADAIRYASLRVGLTDLVALTLSGIGDDETRALSEIEGASKLQSVVWKIVPALLLGGLGLLLLGWALDAWLLGVIGLLALLPLPLVRFLALAASWGSASAIEQGREDLAQAQLRRDEHLAYLERAKRTDDARWLAALVTRHPLLDFQALSGTTPARSADTYRT